ncbi:uncharacterized protein LOC123025187 [Varanus komodoensis]|uniref:uncharacterized protein LOC123025187 n=1 Tax=Varanus komodoensis TaxID=61221 RepID=UPI001CF79583|nr:uncharacterized protein LOC123025187 [Varanus komodoensis]XP_044289642.1 uncharacterized protein LOC123025187 [Varanus komodoensis]XP_044289643.1 uncharacterized protein LOC123025187 [Varanus komodoensis]
MKLTDSVGFSSAEIKVPAATVASLVLLLADFIVKKKRNWHKQDTGQTTEVKPAQNGSRAFIKGFDVKHSPDCTHGEKISPAHTLSLDFSEKQPGSLHLRTLMSTRRPRYPLLLEPLPERHCHVIYAPPNPAWQFLASTLVQYLAFPGSGKDPQMMDAMPGQPKSFRSSRVTKAVHGSYMNISSSNCAPEFLRYEIISQHNGQKGGLMFPMSTRRKDCMMELKEHVDDSSSTN